MNAIGLQTRVQSSLGSNGAACTVTELFGAPLVGLEISAGGVAFTGTISFQGQIKDGSWRTAFGTPIGGGAPVTSATATGAWLIYTAGFTKVRAVVTAYTSGDVVAEFAGCQSSGSPPLFSTTGAPLSEVQGVTATGVAPTEKPVLISGVDGSGNKKAITFNDGTNGNLNVAIRSGSQTAVVSSVGDAEAGVVCLISGARGSQWSDIDSTWNRARSSVGTQANTANATALGAGGTTTAIDLRNCVEAQVFGNAGATGGGATFTMQYSQDNSNYYDAPSETIAIAAAGGNFSYKFVCPARYARFKTNNAITVTATIAAKGV